MSDDREELFSIKFYIAPNRGGIIAKAGPDDIDRGIEGYGETIGEAAQAYVDAVSASLFDNGENV
jgi:hypothetical protein